MSSQGRRRLRIFVIELGLFMLLTCWFVGQTRGGWDVTVTSSDWMVIVARTTLGVITGPMTGAIARPGQEDSVEYSLSLLLPYGAILVTAVLLQLVPLPARPGVPALRAAAWALGWLAWFAGGIHSLLYALE